MRDGSTDTRPSTNPRIAESGCEAGSKHAGTVDEVGFVGDVFQADADAVLIAAAKGRAHSQIERTVAGRAADGNAFVGDVADSIQTVLPPDEPSVNGEVAMAWRVAPAEPENALRRWNAAQRRSGDFVLAVDVPEVPINQTGIISTKLTGIFWGSNITMHHRTISE